MTKRGGEGGGGRGGGGGGEGGGGGRLPLILLAKIYHVKIPKTRAFCINYE